MYGRNISSLLQEALGDTPVVLLNGARQVGKSTLVRNGIFGEGGAPYLTLDDAGVLAAAEGDPAGFVSGLGERIILDEVQRAPGLFPAIKAEVDRDRRPGRFLMTGSANVLSLPKLSESLAGRMEILTLRPLSQGEIEGAREGFVDTLFRGFEKEFPLETEDTPALRERMLAGGYPEALGRSTERRRRA